MPLTGSIAAGGYFLVALGPVGTVGADLPVAANVIAEPPVNLSASAGTIFLANQATALTSPPIGSVVDNSAIRDLVGYGTSNTFETARAAGPSTNSQAANRVLADTDNNSTDFSVGGLSPTASPAPLAATNPGNRTATVDEPITAFALAASGGTTPYTWSASGLPEGITVSAGGTVSGTPTETGAFAVTATVTDAATPAATADTTFTLTVASIVDATIAQIQGAGATTPLAGSTVRTTGVVTAAYPTGGLNGFYLQTPGEDLTPDASDGIFVYGGSSGFGSYPAIGDSVQVTGSASEFSGQTQVTSTSSRVVTLAEPLGTVVPKSVVPGTDCVLPGDDCLTGAALDAAREVVESEAFQPTSTYTATDVYDGSPFSTGTPSSSFFGEIGLAADSDIALVAPTEVIDAQATDAINARKAYNDAHRIILDDGSSTSYTSTTGSAFPWLTADHAVRVGARVTFATPVVFTFGFGSWRMLPTSQVVGAPDASQPQFEQTRAQNAVPQDVGGDVRLATFNVLNFFPTTGEAYVASGMGSCTYFTDRLGGRVTTNNCGTPSTSSGNGPRGAANEENLVRQRDKIVSAINGSGADVISLEELENSVKFGKDRDFAISELVTALNADAGPGTWDFVPSPAPADLPPTDQQDVIRSGFVYRPANIALVGASVVLADQSGPGGDFADAREPLAQAFKKTGTADESAFAVIVNHFKSKGSGNPDPDGQGNANDRRILQAQRLVTFADTFTTLRDLTRVFLAGDFNAYSEEDPIQVLDAAGYTNLESSSDPNEESYNFDGQIGSLDHVLANDAALADVNAVDIWPINANESVYYEYSRFNYNLTNLYSSGPFRSSDHNPELVGINVDTTPGTTVTAGDVTVGHRSAARIVAQVSGGTTTPTGTVSLMDGELPRGSSVLDRNGRAVVRIPAGTYTPGSYQLTASYSGDSTHRSSSTTLTLTVNQVVGTITSNDLAYSYGQSRSLRVNLKNLGGFTPGGTVTVSEDGVVVASETVTDSLTLVPLPTQGLGVGSHALTVEYSGDANLAALSTTSTVTISKDPSTTSATVSPAPATVNQPVTLDVTVSSSRGVEVTGDVEVTVDGTTQTVTLSDGSATVDLGSFASRGKKQVTVVYLGSAVLSGSGKVVSFRVTR